MTGLSDETCHGLTGTAPICPYTGPHSCQSNVTLSDMISVLTGQYQWNE